VVTSPARARAPVQVALAPVLAVDADLMIFLQGAIVIGN